MGYCSQAKCYDPVPLCKKRYDKIHLKDGKPHCHISCMKNGRCQPGIYHNTPNVNLQRSAVFSKLKMKDPLPQRLLRLLQAADDGEDHDDDHADNEPEGWENDSQPAEQPKEEKQK